MPHQADLDFYWLIEDQIAGHSQPKGDADLIWLHEMGIRTLLRMSEHPMVSPELVKVYGFNDLIMPVKDFTAPAPDQLNVMLKFILDSIADGRPVGVSCNAGRGRTGTVLCCFLSLSKENATAEELIKAVRKKQPGAVETTSQIRAIEDFIKRGHGITLGGISRD